MEENLLDMNINELKDLSSNTLNLLKRSNITIISELCKYTKTSLKKLGLSSQEINQIEIALQLLGLDLMNNNY